MKSLKSIGTLTLLFSLFFFVWSCSSGHSSHDQADHSHEDVHMDAKHGEGKAYTSAYVCPMHCEGSGSEEVGTCPVCGMEYVVQTEHIKDGHTH